MRSITLAGRQVSVIGLGAWQFGSRGWGWEREFGRREISSLICSASSSGSIFSGLIQLAGVITSPILDRSSASSISIMRKCSPSGATSYVRRYGPRKSSRGRLTESRGVDRTETTIMRSSSR